MEFWRFGKLGVCSQGYATGEVVHAATLPRLQAFYLIHRGFHPAIPRLSSDAIGSVRVAAVSSLKGRETPEELFVCVERTVVSLD